MKCPQCGTENQSGFKFCVKCGLNLENPEEVNIEQIDMGRAPTIRRWPEMRASSTVITRMYWARSGASMPRSFSTASAKARLFDGGQR